MNVARRLSPTVEQVFTEQPASSAITRGYNEHGERTVTWTHLDGDTYVVTGVDRYGKRFTRTFNNWHHARAINVWRGSKWLVRNGKRIRLVQINN